MPRPLNIGLVGAFLIFTWASGLRAQTQSKRVWLRVFSASRLQDARVVQRLLAPEGLAGGRLRQVFLRTTRGRHGKTLHEVLTGPFHSTMDGVLHGLRLRDDTRFQKAGIRVSALAILLPTSFLPLPLRIVRKSLEQLNPGLKRPYPALGDLVVVRAVGFSLPSHALPAMERSTVQLTPWEPKLVLGERTACNASKTTCLRWFEVLHPVLIRTAWVPAYQLVPHRSLRRVTLAEGKGQTKAKAAFWPIGSSPKGRLYRAMFRRGSMPPQLHTLELADRNKPPYRMVVDRHGPGIYNSEGKVVARIKLRPWIYKRPPLWTLPKSLQGRRSRRPRGRPAMRRPAMGRPVMGRPVMGRPVMGR